MKTDSPFTDLGTKEIHQRHSVMIEGGTLPRAKVMDQTVVDRLLMEARINLHQYQAAEYLLEQAMKSGIHLRSPRMDGLPPGGGRPDIYQLGLMQFGRTLKLVRKALSEAHETVLVGVVVQGQGVRDDQVLGVLKQALDLIVERRLSGGRNPLRHLS